MENECGRSSFLSFFLPSAVYIIELSRSMKLSVSPRFAALQERERERSRRKEIVRESRARFPSKRNDETRMHSHFHMKISCSTNVSRKSLRKASYCAYEYSQLASLLHDLFFRFCFIFARSSSLHFFQARYLSSVFFSSKKITRVSWNYLVTVIVFIAHLIVLKRLFRRLN